MGKYSYNAPRPGSVFNPDTMTWTAGPGAKPVRPTTWLSTPNISHPRQRLTSPVFVYKDVNFWIAQNGHVQCDEDNTYWCEHILDALEANADAEELWVSELASAIVNGGAEVHIDIPMIPSVNQWARIALVLVTDFRTPTYEVIYIGPDEDKMESIGHIHPGEGRMIIRSMIFDWFRSMVTVENLSCKSSSHKYAAQMQWEKHMKLVTKKVAEEWSIYATGTCLTCAAGSNALFDDLVPEVDKKESHY